MLYYAETGQTMLAWITAVWVSKVDLHVCVPNSSNPMELVRDVPHDPTGQCPHSWRYLDTE